MRFFEPTPAFFTWIKRTAKENPKMPIVDCGCGNGDLVVEMREKGLPSLGLDPQFDLMQDLERCAFIMPMTAEDSTFVVKTPSIILTCRPCHDCFPARINRHRHRDSLMFYVGLRHNIEFDLCGATTEVVLKNAGNDGEYVWSVKPNSEDDYEFRLSLLAGDVKLQMHPNISP